MVFKIKLSVILFELHSRLTIYTYYRNGSTLSNSIGESGQLPQLFATDTNKDDLGGNYQRLAKEKRMALVNWIWATLYKMNIFHLIDQVPTQVAVVEQLEELAWVYSKTSGTSSRMPGSIQNWVLNSFSFLFFWLFIFLLIHIFPHLF